MPEAEIEVTEVEEELQPVLAMRAVEVVPNAEFRKSFPAVMRKWREGEENAEPVWVGSHRKAEAVLVSAAHYNELLLAARGGREAIAG